MVARQVLTLKIEVRVLAGEPKFKNLESGDFLRSTIKSILEHDGLY